MLEYEEFIFLQTTNLIELKTVHELPGKWYKLRWASSFYQVVILPFEQLYFISIYIFYFVVYFIVNRTGKEHWMNINKGR